jgi:hypothetical protein
MAATAAKDAAAAAARKHAHQQHQRQQFSQPSPHVSMSHLPPPPPPSDIGGASTRLSWHRALSRGELRLLLLLLGANFLVLFFSIGAEHEWKKEQLKALKEKRPPNPDWLTEFLWRNFEVSTFNVMTARLHCLVLATFRHRDELHALGNLALLAAVAPGVLAAVGARRSIFLYASAAATGFLAELLVWDFLVPLSQGRPVHPNPSQVQRMLLKMDAAEKANVQLPARDI